MTTHEVNCTPDEFDSVTYGTKTFFITERRGRAFEVGDLIVIKRFDTLSRNVVSVFKITYVSSNHCRGVKDGYYVLSIKRP